ncbi:MAG: GPW/gp25 family protein [Chlorobiaceae bacterium]|nr:GPW/gp25 family protein [Chlorobiaceae bacterium]
MELPFIGRGWSFPPTFDRSTAGVQMLDQEAEIASSLEVLLGTAQGERVMMPAYGCNMDELLFESLDTRIRTLMADKIESALLYFEPRIRVEKISIDESPELDGVVLISIDYQVKTTNSRFNMVFPYYRLEGTDINLPITVNSLPGES